MLKSQKSEHNLIIDTDCGVDDAVALMMAFAHPDARVLAITAVNGNTDVEQAARNVRLTLDQIGAEAPVYVGCDRPLTGERLPLGDIMGEDGLGNATRRLPPCSRQPESERAALALIKLAKEYAGDFTLLALGPLTNLAVAARLDPEFPRRAGRLVVMGGAIDGRGNASPSAEFNFLADPEAAAIVFEAGFPEIWLISWETTLKYPLPWTEYERMASNNTTQAAFFRMINEHTYKLLRDVFHSSGYLLPDPLAAAIALEPGLARAAPHAPVRVEISGKHGRGLTSIDWGCRFGAAPNTYVVTEVDAQGVFVLLEAALGAGIPAGAGTPA